MTSVSRSSPPGPDEPVLPEGLTRVPGPTHRSTRHWYDTFDRRLLAAGVELYVEVSGRRARLVAGARDRAPVAADGAAARGARSLRAPDLPEPVRERVAGLTAGRALVALASARTSVREDAVVDSERKTVCRLEVLAAEPLGPSDGAAPGRPGQAGHPGVGRLSVVPLRGYEEDGRLLAAFLGVGGPGLVEGVLAATGSAEAPGSTPPGRDLHPALPAPAAVASILGHLLDTVRANLAGTLARYDEEFLHDLRVAVRRGRTALKLARDVVDEEPRAHLAGELKWLGDATTPARDLDVHVEDLPGLLDAVSPELAGATAPFAELLVTRREAAHRRLGTALRSARFRSLVEDGPNLLAALGDPARAPAGAAGLSTAGLAARRLDETFSRVVKRGRRITPDTPGEAVHDLRKRAKELRYALEFFSGLLPAEEVGGLVKDLKGLQDVLGRFNDSVVQRELLREAAGALAGAGAAPDTLLALGEMTGRLARSGRRARDELAPRFGRLRAWQRDGRWAELLSGLS